jgi:hypothetical protein
METIGPVDDFVVAVNRVEGMEWLGEIGEEEIPPDDDFFALGSDNLPRPEVTLSGRLFFVFANHQALTQMLSLWRRWQAGRTLDRGYGKWKELFGRLRDIRPWGLNDRLLETGVLADWRDRIASNEEIVHSEVELWFRRDEQARVLAERRVADLVTGQQGRVISSSVVEEISYHGLLVELPASLVQRILEGTAEDIGLVQCERIQFFRAAGQMASLMRDGQRFADSGTQPESERADGEPIIALLDGLPLQSHRRLAGRLIVDDPDGLEPAYPAAERCHGTAMASLILHGDISSNEAPLARPLYVRPILQPRRCDWLPGVFEEALPEHKLPVDLLNRAVRRLFEGEGHEPPVAPSIRVVNLSIGIRDRPFEGSPSPLARLLDWLAWKYKVLFVVSAGNHLQELEIGAPVAQLLSQGGDRVQEAVLKSVSADARHRRLLSPAEAVNALTVGSLHSDQSSGGLPPRGIDPYVDPDLPSPINAQGMGFRRAIKPDVLAPGGRVVLQEPVVSQHDPSLSIYDGPLAPGQRVAAPGAIPGDTSALWYTRGTSTAAALTSRSAAMLHDVIEELRNNPGGDLIDSVPRAVWLKALLVHGADWGHAGEILDRVLRTPERSRQFREYVSRLLGYGAIDVGKMSECTAYRVTALGGGELNVDESHLHNFPLPPSLSGRTGWRRLTITLAWFTPVNPAHMSWRRAALWFTPPKDPLHLDRSQADGRAVTRGTVQHEILEGDHAAPFVDGDGLAIRVNCRAEAGSLEVGVPYALAVTLEVGEQVGVPIYDEIRLRVQAARVTVSAAD